MAEIERTLRAEADPRRGAGQKADREKRSPNPPGPAITLEYLGAGVPLVRRTTKAALQANPQIGRQELLALAERLWTREVYDLRLAAIEALTARNRLLVPEDIAAVEPFVRQAGTWALIDPLALSVVAPLVECHPPLTATLDRWAGDADFWVQRTALLPALRRGGGDFARFAGYADAILEERGFYIRKTIGWGLARGEQEAPRARGGVGGAAHGARFGSDAAGGGEVPAHERA